MSFAGILVLAAVLLSGLPSFAAADSSGVVRDGGVSAIWVLTNFAYAGMRAQDNRSGWRVVAFIFGLPGTLLSFFVVPEGGERAYGVDLPRKDRSGPS